MECRLLKDTSCTYADIELRDIIYSLSVAIACESLQKYKGGCLVSGSFHSATTGPTGPESQKLTLLLDFETLGFTQVAPVSTVRVTNS